MSAAAILGIRLPVFVLTYWKIVQRETSAGDPFSCLCGHVFGHEQFPPGTFIQTSAVRSHRVEFDALIVATLKGSEYWLANPDPREPYAKRDLLLYLREKGSVQLKSESEGRTQPVTNVPPRAEPSFAELLAPSPTIPQRRATDRQLLGGEDALGAPTTWSAEPPHQAGGQSPAGHNPV